jgi:hypothetical protein
VIRRLRLVVRLTPFWIAIAPVLLAAVTAVVDGGGFFSDNGAGAALWLLVATVPAAIVLEIAIRVVVFARSRFRR